MPQLAVAAWAAFSTAATAAATAVTATLTAAGISAGIAGTIGTIAGYVQVANQVIGGVQAVASALGIGQKQPSLRGVWEQNRLTVDASASRKLIVGRTALAGSLRAQFQVGKYKDWFWQTIALGGAGPIESLDGVVIERQIYTINGNGQCSYAPNDMQVFFRSGAWNQTAITSFPLRNASETPQGQWTANHRGAGIAHVLWVARENPKVFTKGKPQPLFLVKGQTDLIDPRTGTTALAAHRDNPAVWEYTWRLGFKSPVGYGSVELGGFQKSVDQLDTATYAAWANRCEALGWKVSGEIDLNEDREAVSRAFCQAGAAVPITKGGKDSVFYQSVKTSLLTLTEADFVGEIEVQTSPEIRDRANGIVPRFRSEAHGWEQIAGSLVTDSSYVTEDGGSRIAEVQFPLVVSATQAGQLAAYQMVQSRERLLLRGPVHPKILAVGPGEAVTINVPSRGISNVKFIMEGRSIGTDGAITCSFRSETDSKHSYATGVTITVPDTSLPNLSDGNIDSPTAGVWTAAVAQITSGATSLPIIRVTGAVESFRVAAILIRYRTTAGPGPWNNLAPANRDATRIEIDQVTPNTSYDLEVSYISVTGKESAWTTIGTVTTGTLVAGEAGTGIGGAPILNSQVTGFANQAIDTEFNYFNRTWSALFASGGTWSVARFQALGATQFLQRSSSNAPAGAQFNIGQTVANCLPVQAGQRLEASGLLSFVNVSSCRIDIAWLDSAGVFITSTAVANGVFDQVVGSFVTVPSGIGAAYAQLVAVFFVNAGSTFTAGNLARPFLRIASAEQSVLTTYTPGPVERNADQTGSNTAAGIVGQGDLATTNRAQLPFGANQVVNSDFTRGTYGWASGAGAGNWGVNLSPAWSGQRNVFFATVPTLADGVEVDSSPATLWSGAGLSTANTFAMPVVQGDRILARALVARHSCRAQLWILTFNSSGGLNAAVPVEGGRVDGAGLGDPANFDELVVSTVAPAGARYAILMLRMIGNPGGSTNPYVFMTEPLLARVPAGQTTAPPYTPGRTDPIADRTSDNTAGGIVGQGSGATANNLTQLNPVEGSKLGGIEAGADVTANAVPSVEGPTSITFDVDGSGNLNPGSQVPRTLQFVRKRGNTDVSSSTTWSIVSAVNVTLGAITNGGVNVTAVAAGNSAFTVRSVRDGVTIDHVVTVQKNTIAAGVVSATRKTVTTTNGTPNNGNWTDVASLVISNCPTGNLFFDSSFSLVTTGTGTCSHQARLTVDGVQVGTIQAAQPTVTGGVPEAVDFTNLFSQVIPVTAGSRTIAFQLQRTTGTGQITASNTRFDVAAFPG